MSEQDIEFDLETGEEIRRPPVVDSHDESGDDDGHDDDGHDDDSDDVDEADEASKKSDDVGEAEGESGEPEDEREAIRARRREERKHRKQAAREREDTLRRELAARDRVINDLQSRVEAIDKRNNSGELARIQQAKEQTAQAYNYYKDQIRVATEAQNGAVVADATEKLLQSQRRFEELSKYEKAYQHQRSAPQPLDPRLVNHAQAWMGQNKWYDPSGTDADSRIALTIDTQMAEEGWNPTTEEYWKELSVRIKKYLPHRASKPNGNGAGNGAGQNGSSRPRSVVPNSARDSAPGGKSTFVLSADRVQALKDAGVWDDQKQRAEAIKRYREYDKQHGRGS